MGQTYVLGHGAFVPASQFVAKATFSTLPFGKYGGEHVAMVPPPVPSFAADQVQSLRGLGSAAYGLGIVPTLPVIAGTAAAATAIGGLLAMVQNALDDDWADSTVFASHARGIHSAMLAIQCIVGGADPGKPLVDTLGNEICKGGTVRACALSASNLTEWRALRDGFAKFWSDTADSMFGPTNAQALRLKGYAREFHTFYVKIASVCNKQGVRLPAVPALPQQEPEKPAPAWLKWTVVGVGIVSAAFVARLIWNR
jgi:hypothetical protein